MKRLREKSNKHQGLKETYLASLEKPRKILEDTFQFLELKGNSVKVFKPNKNVNEVVQTLNRMEPLITQENDIPHAQTKLKNFPSLHKYFGDHLIEGLYMLQFRKCEDETCCIRKKESLPPPVPAPVLSADGEHYLPFEDTYGKLSTTDKNCPSLQQKHNKPKPNTKQNFKFLGSRVVAVLECAQYEKARCIFSMQSQLTPPNQQLLEDIILTCRMLLDSTSLYTATNLSCNCLIENAYYGSKSTKVVCAHCEAADIRSAEYKSKLKQYKNSFPVCQHCFNKGKKEICRSLVEPLISSSNKGNISNSVERVTTNKSVKGCYSNLSPGTSIDEVVQFNVCQTDDKVVVINEIKRQSIIA